MLQTVTITSKHQITIPADVFRRLNFEEGDRLFVDVDKNRVVMQKTQILLDELAGSVSIPKEYQGLSLDEIIDKAKEEHFKKQYEKTLR